MKPKEYLVKHGHLDKIGRGRLSAEHIAIIEKAVSEGVRIEGYSVSKSDTGAIERVDKSAPEFLEPAPYTYPEDEFQAIEFADGKRVLRSMREACYTCKVSLCGHMCDDPRIVRRDGCGSVSVKIERIK